ncbi:toxin TcdB middle/N-terminal domain-containing protein [Sorangium sp. So ce1128]
MITYRPSRSTESPWPGDCGYQHEADVRDLVYLRHDSVRIYTNQSGSGFGPSIELPGLPDHGPMSSVEVFDLLGTGTACIVWSSSLPGFGAAPVRYIDLLGGEKPYLLTSVRNNLGLETRVRYAPSTRFYLADRAAGRPWVTRLPFPVHVVERVETYDHVSRVRLVSEYRYHHGHYDGHEREFRGFGMVEQVDTEAFSAHLGQGLFPEVTVRNDELPQPPVVTKTWFHTGAWARGAAISRQYEKEYYALDPEAPRLPDTLLEAGLSAEERRQACRVLRGQVLRQEVYALDGTPAERHPYSVAEKSFAVRRVEPARSPSPGVFLVVPREAISLVYERLEDAEGRLDPRVTQEFMLEVDAFGAVRKSATVAYPRRRVPSDPDLAAQGRLLATLVENDVVHLDSTPEGYRLGIPIETRTFELQGLVAPREGLSFEAMSRAAAGADASPVKRLIQQQRFRYYDSASLPSPLPFGSADALALPYERYALALTAEQIAQTFNAGQERVTPAILAEGGYVQLPGESGFWIPSGRLVFDPSRFYLPVSTIDPFGATSTVAYDAYALLVTGTEDALGNQVHIDNDYRALSPAMITDANGNRASVQLDELGMVVAEAVMGREGSADGDTLEDPTTVFRYELFEFRDSGRPGFAHVRRRERHGDPSTRWLETWVYSDGTGHEILRKERAEPGPVPFLDGEGRVVREADGQPSLMRAESRWVGSGRTVFDNKGNPIKKYESYFSHRPDYDPEEELAQWGVTPILRYDPLGRAVRVDLPNGTSRRVEFTPWEQTSWDENDTVLEPGNLWHAARQPGATPAEQRGSPARGGARRDAGGGGAGSARAGVHEGGRPRRGHKAADADDAGHRGPRAGRHRRARQRCDGAHVRRRRAGDPPEEHRCGRALDAARRGRESAAALGQPRASASERLRRAAAPDGAVGAVGGGGGGARGEDDLRRAAPRGGGAQPARAGAPALRRRRGHDERGVRLQGQPALQHAPARRGAQEPARLVARPGAGAARGGVQDVGRVRRAEPADPRRDAGRERDVAAVQRGRVARRGGRQAALGCYIDIDGDRHRVQREGPARAHRVRQWGRDGLHVRSADLPAEAH